jgi:hypothetical protein
MPQSDYQTPRVWPLKAPVSGSFAGARPRGQRFRLALDEALQQMQEFLELQHSYSQIRPVPSHSLE